jgi:hypothetical protein
MVAGRLDRARRTRCWAGGLALAFAAFYGCVGEIGEPSGPAEPLPPPPGAELAVPSGARRLSRTEYDATLRDLLQDKSSSGFAKLPEDVHDPFDNDYHAQKVSPALIEALETLANEAAARAVADPAVRAAIVPCTPTGPADTACLAAFIARFGRRALRRPLAAEEVDEIVTQLSPFAVEGNDFFIGVELAIAALLQDLELVYRVERGTPVAGMPGVFALGDHEIATRMSYFLLGSTPQDPLLDLADQGKLRDPADRRAAAATLLAEPRARDRIDRFHALWLGYHQLPHAAELVGELRAESRALVERVVFDAPGDYFELFRSAETLLTPALAAHYGYAAPAAPGWAAYPDARRGILSHGSVLSSFGKFADTSPTQRGIFIRTRLLCQEVPKPPPNVDADSPPGEEAGNCKLDRYAQHSAGGCYNCHKLLDPIGFGLERYDNQGRYRTHDDGKPDCPIAGEGSIDGVGDFRGPAELADLVMSEGLLEPCVVLQLYRFAHGRREVGDDEAILVDLGARFASAGHDFGALMLELVSLESFGFRREEAAP